MILGEHFDLIIRDAMIIQEHEIVRADLGILNGKIAAIEKNISEPALEEICASGLYVFPGMIDTHVHCNEPGRTEWEGFSTATRSLAAGGVTTFFDMPLNSIPPTTTISGFNTKQAAASVFARIDYALWGGLIPGNIDQLSELDEKGVIGFKAFLSTSGVEEFPCIDDLSLWEGMEEISKLNSILAVHAESEMITRQLTDAWLSSNAPRDMKNYTWTRPILAEVEAVQRVLTYAELTGCRLHIVHASCAEVVHAVTLAKERGVAVTVETCPHYLALSEEDAEKWHGIAKCAPPLRSRKEAEALWECVRSGEVDTIASDHSPCPIELKLSPDISKVWGGISGAQTSLLVLLEEGYVNRDLSLLDIARLTATTPAHIFGLYPQKGVLAVGSDADIVLIDLVASQILQKEHLYYRHPHSPFIGKEFHSKIVATYVRGQQVYGDHIESAEILRHGNFMTRSKK